MEIPRLYPDFGVQTGDSILFQLSIFVFAADALLDRVFPAVFFELFPHNFVQVKSQIICQHSGIDKNIRQFLLQLFGLDAHDLLIALPLK